MSRLVSGATVAAALGCCLVAGVFFAFSTFVMPALSRLPAPTGIEAMQSINVAAINAWLMGALFGTAALCMGVAVASMLRWSVPGAPLRFAACATYLFGTIVVTAACNVPLNEALAPVHATDVEAAQLWGRYLVQWSLWNHVRGIAAFVAAALFAVTLLARPASRAAAGESVVPGDAAGRPLPRRIRGSDLLALRLR